MDQIKIGKFIAARRRAAGLTQVELAAKLAITDRAVSKWERGKALPDASIMLMLCEILGISVNDLLSGEVVSSESLKEESEHNILGLVKAKENADKLLLRAEIIISILALIPFIASIAAVILIPMEEWVSTLIILSSLIPLLVCLPFVLKIEQSAGYYECTNCAHRYIPRYASVFFAQHIGLKRRMRCPHCGRRCWHNKILSEEINDG